MYTESTSCHHVGLKKPKQANKQQQNPHTNKHPHTPYPQQNTLTNKMNTAFTNEKQECEHSHMHVFSSNYWNIN